MKIPPPLTSSLTPHTYTPTSPSLPSLPIYPSPLHPSPSIPHPTLICPPSALTLYTPQPSLLSPHPIPFPLSPHLLHPSPAIPHHPPLTLHPSPITPHPLSCWLIKYVAIVTTLCLWDCNLKCLVVPSILPPSWRIPTIQHVHDCENVFAFP